MTKRQITIKPTCMRELLAFPSDRASVLWEKINLLVSDPLPDGKVKKKLQGAEGIYRLRVGDHRVFYQFGESWVSLLGIRRRSEDTYDDIPTADDAPQPPAGEADLDAALAKAPYRFQLSAPDESPLLPVALTRDWLTGLGVPLPLHAAFSHCKTEDDLLAAAVPSEVLARVIDAIFPPAIRQVVSQPDMVVPSTDHLVKFKEGDLLGFLLNLDADQSRLTKWALAGPTMVCGGAGTGKSTIALYRVKEALERKGATGNERLLFATYTRALITVTRQLLEQILTPEQLARVRIATCDQIAIEVVRNARPVGDIEGDRDTLRRLKAARKEYSPNSDSPLENRLKARALERLSDDYLIEEFDWILSGRGINSLDEYQDAPRPGRGVAFPTRTRAAVWELYRAFQSTKKVERFPDLRSEALGLVRSGGWKQHWDAVFVDEAQDLSPTALSLMAELCSSAEGIFFCADTKQSLYSRSYSWTSANPRLQFRGRTATLNRNYRSTEEIDRAAFSLLRPDEGAPLESSTSLHHGPLPVLVRGVAAGKEAEWIVRFVRQASKHLHLRQSAAAVLVPTADFGQQLAEALDDEGLPSKFFAGRDLDLRADTVKVLSMYSAKGLEFPVVVACGFHDGTYPVPGDFEDRDLFDERMRHERRLLYVAVTRAMRGLMVIVPPNCRHEALANVDASQWHVEEAKA